MRCPLIIATSLLHVPKLNFGILEFIFNIPFSLQIFCAKCGSKDLTIENDIILCDGACERGFHQFCLDPPLLKEDSNV